MPMRIWLDFNRFSLRLWVMFNIDSQEKKKNSNVCVCLCFWLHRTCKDSKWPIRLDHVHTLFNLYMNYELICFFILLKTTWSMDTIGFRQTRTHLAPVLGLRCVCVYACASLKYRSDEDEYVNHMRMYIHTSRYMFLID